MLRFLVGQFVRCSEPVEVDLVRATGLEIVTAREIARQARMPATEGMFDLLRKLQVPRDQYPMAQRNRATATIRLQPLVLVAVTSCPVGDCAGYVLRPAVASFDSGRASHGNSGERARALFGPGMAFRYS
jgi:hypothetical protein